MDQNLDWTTALGEAFLDQPADVMNAIQGLRREAIAAGNLADSPQQQVVQEESVIRIVPADPDVIYVPQYDPDVVYVQPYSQNFGPVLTFGAGFAVGSWLNYDCDWRRRSIYVGQWRPGWNRDWDRGDRDRDWNRRDRGQSDNLVDVVNINSDTARQWQPSANSQRRQARLQRNNNRANARLSNTSVQDAGEQPGAMSTLNPTRSADPRETRVPKPSRPDFTSRRDERTRRDDGSTSDGSPPAPTAPADATPGAPRENQNVSATTVAPNVPGEQPDQRSGKGGNARNLNKQDSPQDMAPNASKGTSALPGAPGENQKVPAPTAAPKISGEQDAPGQSGGQRGGPRNLSKRAQESQQNPSRDASGASDARRRNDEKSAPTVAPSVPGEQGAPAERTRKGESPRNMNKQDSPQDTAPNASDAMPAARTKNEKKSAPTAAPNVPGASGPSGGQRGGPRNVDKQSPGNQSKDGVVNQPPDAPKPKKTDQPRSSPPRSISAPNPSNGQKPVQQPAPPQPKQKEPSQQASAAEPQDKQSQRSAPAVNQDAGPRPPNPSQGKGEGKGGREKKTDEKKNKSDN